MRRNGTQKALLTAAISAALLLSGCGAPETNMPEEDSPWAPAGDVRIARLRTATYKEADPDAEVAWSGRLVEREGCLAVETDGGLKLAGFYSDAVAVRKTDTDQIGVRIAPQSVLVTDQMYSGTQMPVVGTDGLGRFTNGLTCADALGVEEAVLIHSADSVAK